MYTVPIPRSSSRLSRCLFGVCLLLSLPRESPAWQAREAPIMTPWAALVDNQNPLPEYPRPQMVRARWASLNGIWQFQAGADGDAVPANQVLSGEIRVPFPMESALSGVMQHHPRAWYRRTFTVPPTWTGQRILLHLDAVDWESQVFINGQSTGTHRGGYDAITYDITDHLVETGPQEIIVRVFDPTDNYGQPRGKQTLAPGGIMYTSSSGIWQTVWLEPVPATRVADFSLAPDIDLEQLRLTVNVSGPANGVTVQAVARVGRDQVGTVTGAPGTPLIIPVPNPTLWTPDTPFLYNLDISLRNGPAELDSVTSYFGMRKVSLGMVDGFHKMLLNDEFVFHYGPLDQGFWPDGIYTAPTDDALKSDIEQTKLLGFNMIRKHIKVEPARWYYWADRLGILVWQDMPSVNSYTGNPQPIDVPQFETELVRMVEGHRNHPSIVSWVIFNESQGQHDTGSLVQLVETMDPTRLVNEASGGTHTGAGSVLDVHSYPNPSYPVSSTRAVVCGEFGGLGLSVTNHIWAPGWGYGGLLSDAEELASRFEQMCVQLSGFVENHGLSGAVYTEITDVEIELNGFLTYDRAVRKPDVDRIRAAVYLAGTPLALTPVVPTSQATPQSWTYTTSTPGGSWTSPSFDDSAWDTGPGGFGAGDPPNTGGLTRTPWTTGDIWLRRTFDPGSLTAQQVSNLVVYAYHDEDVEIYINGVEAAGATGYITSYSPLSMTAAGRAAIQTNASNVLAVHCRQTTGGQYIDVGLSILESVPTPPARPVPTRPANLQAAAGNRGVSLGWDSSPGATEYTIRRSTQSGGPYTTIVQASAVNACFDAGVMGGVTYYYVVSASNATDESAGSDEVSVTALVPPPPPPPPPPGCLMHRWSFDDGTDAIGGADATLVGAAFYAGGELHVPGGSPRANAATVNINHTLGAHSNLTIEVWFTMDSLQDWSKIWMFGHANDGAQPGLSYIDFTPRRGGDGNVPSINLDTAFSTEVNTAGGVNPPVLTADQEYYVAAVYNTASNQMVLYLDGVLVDSAPMNNGDITQIQATEAWFGAAVYFGDDNLDGSINELRIWDNPLSAEQVLNNHQLGPDAIPLPILRGAMVNDSLAVLWWPETFPCFDLQWSPILAPDDDWTPVLPPPVHTNGSYVVTVPATNSISFFRLASGSGG